MVTMPILPLMLSAALLPLLLQDSIITNELREHVSIAVSPTFSPSLKQPGLQMDLHNMLAPAVSGLLSCYGSISGLEGVALRTIEERNPSIVQSFKWYFV